VINYNAADGGLREWAWLVADSLRDSIQLNDDRTSVPEGPLRAYEPHLADIAHAARLTQGKARALRAAEAAYRVAFAANLTVETALLGLLMEATGKDATEILSQVLADVETVHPRSWEV